MGISGDSARSVLDDDLGLSLLLMRCLPKASCPDQSNLRSELSADVSTETEANNEQRFPRGSFDSMKFKVQKYFEVQKYSRYYGTKYK